ncbi:MAG TPA: GNAT family N-acetyltransferase [Anaerolineales bacterium]|nr:GNAT family N-acetyltransferase [Anaerolineales bacterium]
MIEIVPCKDRFEELIRFVARLNPDGAHHIGFFGESEADIRASLAESQIPPADAFTLAYEADRVVGTFGVDADPEISRAWLFGPLIEHADWHMIAEQLYASILPLVPVNIRDYDLFCDVQNVHIDEFALKHGFPLTSENAVLILAREDYRPIAKRQTQIIPYQEAFFEHLEKLHKTLFPNAYFTARQMVEKIDELHCLFLAVEDGNLFGYHFGKIEPESESSYVDFIGTDVSARRRGIGADLLASGLDWMLAVPTTQKVRLTVNANNVAARHLYEKFGFLTERIMRGYRKQIA